MALLAALYLKGGESMEAAGLAFNITSTMVEPITTAINSGLTTLVPIGIAVMASMIGISLIPRIVYKFL